MAVDHGSVAASGRPGLSCVRAIDLVELSTETVGKSLARLARDAPRDPALIWITDVGPESMSWSDLYTRSRSAAAWLCELNPHGGRVAVAAPNSVEWIVAMYACALAGFAVVPISPTVTDSEAAYLLSHAGVAVVLSAAGDHRVLDRMRAVGQALSSPAAIHDIGEITLPSERSWVPQRTVEPDDEFLVQYTSGTTGQPKAASLSHRAVVNIGRIYGQATAAEPGERWLVPLPLHHVGGTIAGVITTLSFGGPYVLVDQISPQALIRAIREARPALIGLVPTMLIDLLAMPGITAADFSCVRTVISGATAVDPGLIDDVERKLEVTFMVAYGQSEAPVLASSSPSDTVFVRTNTLGRCLPGRDYMICDRTGRPVAKGTVGELCARGPLIMSGYLRSDGELDPAVDGAGWLHTGDLCSMDDDGVLTFRGRIRDIIVRGGLNVYPAEVEHALSAHESLCEVAIFAATDDRLGERVVAAVLPASGADVDVDALAAFAEDRLSRHKRPAEWIVVTSLPRTSAGKVRKHLLREWYDNGTLRAKCGAVSTV